MAIKAKNVIPPLSTQHLEAICKVLAETDTGLKGSQIGYLLQDCQIVDTDPTLTKWSRLFNAFVGFQNEHQAGNGIFVFITKAMDPAMYTDRPEVYRLLRDKLNAVLAFCGLHLREDGKVIRQDKASTIDQALQRANRLRASLIQRAVHADVLKYCTAELLDENFFHAVFEAIKSITAKLRQLTGSTKDGTDLVHHAFGDRDGPPLLIINTYDTETMQMEQRGFMSLLKGIYGTIRNPLAHDPRIEWDMNEQDTLDILTMISLVHRKLDKVEKNIKLKDRTY
jgi:uncharacterized protein (TIGR02391 family)